MSARSLPATDAVPGAPCIIVNPTKLEDDALGFLVRQTRAIAGELGLPAPRFVETTTDDPGTGQARWAVDAGASVVVAAGGDGTARAVAAGVARTGVPMGIVPLGTGNLFARNLHLPLHDTNAALRVALGGWEHRFDVGWLRTHHAFEAKEDDHGLLVPGEEISGTAPGPDEVESGGTAPGPVQGGDDPTQAGARPAHTPGEPPEELFLVIGGIGFDADMVAGADGELKRRVGWIAYFVAAIPRLLQRRMEVMVTVDGTKRSRTFRARTVMVANCGRLPGGLTLAPSAQPDDGVLDAVALDTRGGLVGWASLGARVVLQSTGLRNDANLTSTIASKSGRTFTIHASTPQPVEVDGEVLGFATEVQARVDEGALLVRVPH